LNESQANDVKMEVTVSVLKYAEAQGITHLQLLDMVESSAKFSHELGNRRFHSWLFWIENNVVKRMIPLAKGVISGTLNRQVPVPGPGEFLVYDECMDCEGVGCQKCDDTGEVPVIRKNPKSR